MAKIIRRWWLVPVAFVAGAIVIPIAIHALFLLCIAILPFDLNWLPDTRIFRSALGGFLAVWLPVVAAPSYKKRVAVGTLLFIWVSFGILIWWLGESVSPPLEIWGIVIELVSPVLATILALVLTAKGVIAEGRNHEQGE